MTTRLRSNPESRFIIVLNMPSGAQMVVTTSPTGHFAMTPLLEGQKMQVMSWVDTGEITQWLKEFKKLIGEEEWAKFMAMKPQVGRIGVSAIVH